MRIRSKGNSHKPRYLIFNPRFSIKNDRYFLSKNSTRILSVLRLSERETRATPVRTQNLKQVRMWENWLQSKNRTALIAPTYILWISSSFLSQYTFGHCVARSLSIFGKQHVSHLELLGRINTEIWQKNNNKNISSLVIILSVLATTNHSWIFLRFAVMWVFIE